MTRQPAIPRQRSDRGWGRSLVRRRPQLVCYATACWSLLYGVLGSFWALGGAGYPFGGADDDTVLATSRAATAGPVMATVGLAGGVLALAMAQGRGRGPARSALIGYGAVMAVTLTVMIPGHRPLMALARTPLVLIGAPFGWPPQLNLGEFFTSMYPWPVINELLLILGGRGGHAAAWTTPASARRWGAWAVAVAVAVPTFYALTRWAWALGIPLGFSRQALRAEEAQSPASGWPGPAWPPSPSAEPCSPSASPNAGERSTPDGSPPRRQAVRPRTAIVPATVVAVLVTSAGMAYLRAMLTGQVSLNWGSGPALLWPVWGAALGAATLAYHLRRRGHCRHCHR